jgi:hypothetical protein
MFGFGRPSREKAVIKLFASQFEALGFSHGAEAIKSSTAMIDELIAELKPHYADLFKSTQGDEFAAKEQFIAPRLAAGLLIQDIKYFWNRPLLIIFAEMKMRERINFVILEVARLQGKDTSEAALNYKKTFPRYGDPASWNSNDKYNVGLCEQDADIFLEFASRVDAWRKKTTDATLNVLLARHGTLNAVIRSQILIKAL